MAEEPIEVAEVGEEAETLPQERTTEKGSFNPPWEKIELKDDQTDLKRTLYVFKAEALGVRGRKEIPIVFKHLLDPLTSADLGNKAIPTRKSFDSVLKALDYFEVPRTQLATSFSPRSIPRPGNFDYEIVTAIATCSLYDEEGKLKPYDDAEGWAFFTSYLMSAEPNPEMADQCLSRLKQRMRFLPIEESGDTQSTMRLLGEKPSWGKIPLEKVTMVHVTNYLPKLGVEGAAILPRIDTDGVPRWTIHFFGNGMVEEHGIAGLNQQSWEIQKYVIIANFAEAVLTNGLPANIFRPDTFWSIFPGRGFRLTPRTTIIAPLPEVEGLEEKYSPFGVEVRGYQESTPLRTATSEMFRQKDIPWIEGLDPKVAGEGDHRLGNFLGLPDKSHERTNEGHLDYGYGRCWEAVLLGSEYTTKPGRRYLDDKEAKNIAPLGTQFGPLVERARALSTAIGNTREYVVERLRRKDNDRISEKALQVALLSGFL